MAKILWTIHLALLSGVVLVVAAMLGLHRGEMNHE
jgi:hypothetical protein